MPLPDRPPTRPSARIRAAGRWLVATSLAALALAAFPIRTEANVPTPGPTSSVITVKVGGDRAPAGTVDPLAHVELRLLHDNNNAPGSPVDHPWAHCTSDAQGDCSFVVPDTDLSIANGGNQNRRFWVQGVDVPAGWHSNPTLRVGSATAAESAAKDYEFRTGASLLPGQTYRSGTNFMTDLGTGTNQRESSGGVWQQSRNNPDVPSKCGLDVALILDLSGSVGADLPLLKGAADTLIDTLRGTPSRIAVFSFAYTSPAAGGSNHPSLQPISTVAGANAAKSIYANWTVGGGTNWDRGIASASNAAEHYDVAIVITDGNPTNWGVSTGSTGANGSGSNNRIREVEEAVFSSNGMKAQRTKVVALGVGAGVQDANTGFNLRAISGRTRFDGTNPLEADYFQEPTFTAAANALSELALASCQSTLSVVKQIVPSGNTGEDITGAVPAGSGWVFHATGSPGVTPSPPEQTTTEDGTGSVNFDLAYSGGTLSGPVTITEDQHANHTLVTQNGFNAVCTDLATGTNVPVTNAGAAGFTVDTSNDASLSCTMYNRPPVPEANVTVDKHWVVNGEDFADGEQPDSLAADLRLTGPDGAPTDVDWGVTAHGYLQGDTPTINEDVHTADFPPRCTLDSKRLTEANGTTVDEALPFTVPPPGLNAGANHFAITNVVTCDQRLTLVKHVNNEFGGTAEPGHWTLTASGPTDVSGPGNSEQVTDQDVPVGEFHLSETGAPEGYDTTGWDCVGGEQLHSHAVSVGLGQAVTCTVANTEIPGHWELTKTSDPPSGSVVQPGSVIAYTLTATNPSRRGIENVVVRDDLSQILDHSTLLEIPEHAALEGHTLVWHVPRMEPNGGTQTLTYRVRVHQGAFGVDLRNVATPGFEGDCNNKCDTDHDTANPPLPETGGPGGTTGAAGSHSSGSPVAPLLLLVLAGGVGTGIAIRVSRRHGQDASE